MKKSPKCPSCNCYDCIVTYNIGSHDENIECIYCGFTKKTGKIKKFRLLRLYARGIETKLFLELEYKEINFVVKREYLYFKNEKSLEKTRCILYDLLSSKKFL